MEKTLVNQLDKFREMSIEISKKCLMHKSEFRNENHNKINHSGNFNMQIYFNDNWKTWSFRCEDAEWANYKKGFELGQNIIYDPQMIEVINEQMFDCLNSFEDRYAPKKRELNFK